jgi:hypothetical protein
MLMELVQEGSISNTALKYVCAEGMMSDSLEKDIDTIYYAKADGVDVNERYVPRRNSKEEGLENSEIGDVFEVEGENNIYIKNKNGEAEQLKLDKETFIELFPIGERFATSQGGAGDCYYLSAINALMDNPNSRADVLQCFSKNENGIQIKFPKSDYVYTSVDGNLNNNADPRQIVTAARGMQLLEHAFGFAVEDVAVKQYYEIQNTAISDYKMMMDNTTDETQKLEYQTKIDNLENAKKTFQEDRNSSNPRLVLMRDVESLDVLTDENGGIYQNVNQVAYYKTTADYYRAEGGFSCNVFKLFGYDSSIIPMKSDEARETLSHVEDSDSYIFAGGTKGQSVFSIESKMNRNLSMYSSHAYRIIPFKDDEGNVKYRVSNPWNAAHDAVMTIEQMDKYFDHIYAAKIKE